jgi:hypothetical protein
MGSSKEGSMNWFVNFLNWLWYRNYTPENLVLGSEKADKLKKEIRGTVHLLLLSIDPQVFRSSLICYIDKSALLAEYEFAEGETLQWWLDWNEVEKKLAFRCISPGCYEEGKKRPPELFFSSLGQSEMPIERLIPMHKALKQVIRKAVRHYGGTGSSLEPFVKIAQYQF